MPHYRRLTPAQYAQISAAPGSEPAAAIGAVVAGRPSGDYVLHVSTGDNDALPGTFLAATLADIPAPTYGAVAEAEWTDEEGGEPVRGRSKVNVVPEGATVTATDLPPNVWA